MFTTSFFNKIFWLTALLIIAFNQSTLAQNEQQQKKIHEFTIYAIPTLEPLNWESPSALYKTMRNCYFKTIAVPDNYLLGHVAVRLTTPLLPEPLLVAMTSANPQEKVDLILKKKVGYGIMGATLGGRLETEPELKHKLSVYAKRNKLAFVTFRVNETAARRMLGFIKKYSEKKNEKYAPSDFYGGSFWPLYTNEGSGCSAFGAALLDAADLLLPFTDNWKLEVKIPTSIIGGEYNNGKKVRFSTISKTNKWHNGEGQANVDYVDYLIYEPSVMFKWILDKRTENTPDFLPIEENGVPGLYFDGSSIQVSDTIRLFEQRPEPNLFINRYFQKTGMPKN
jgi:hypothetical protein